MALINALQPSAEPAKTEAKLFCQLLEPMLEKLTVQDQPDVQMKILQLVNEMNQTVVALLVRQRELIALRLEALAIEIRLQKRVLDGKHVLIKRPSRSGSNCFNYKHQFSIVLLAVCDADGIFRYIDIGGYGHESDGGLFDRSDLKKALDDANNPLNIPSSAALPNTEVQLPFFFVADAAFPLLPNIMKPYGGRNLTDENQRFNYRISRARITIERAFGVLTARWRVLLKPIEMKAENIDNVIWSTVALHNIISVEFSSVDNNLQQLMPLTQLVRSGVARTFNPIFTSGGIDSKST
ncbi:hypothetical protein M3Y98_00092900 [Aphelenchoides besseyi]|nr:hypothetical protein M3Y98_00092900 [Aphelenchoides besseyi]KAI6198528.1 hypothetical protein M3Y96_00528700 [Aphelenchoides besseyi]